MKIKRLGYENFRNFKARGDIKFRTDGTVNIIYGGNGAGKTTLHQLFQWIFYNTVSFNKSSSDKLYNLEFESEQPVNSRFTVMGEVEFEHEGEQYLLRREHEYEKKVSNTINVNKRVTLSKKSADYNWDRVPGDSSAFIEKILPSGLSAYFFFDGERMITDLMEKGYESSRKLKKALYSIFNLNIYERASRHIGAPELRTSVIGKLYLKRTGSGNQTDINALRTNLENVTGKIEELEANIESKENTKQSNSQVIREISETIGEAKTRKEYEEIRKTLKSTSDAIEKQIKDEQLLFGDRLIQYYPKILASKSVMLTKKMLKHKVDTETLVPGIEKPLIEAILSGDGTCICGKRIDNDAKEHLEHYFDLLPPASYKKVYDTFTKEAETIATDEQYDLSIHIKKILDYKKQQYETEEKVRWIDDELKVIGNIENLINQRRNLEEENMSLTRDLTALSSDLTKYKILLNKFKKQFDKATEDNSSNNIIMQKINIMQEVKQYFDDELVKLAREYSKKLCEAIRQLLETMLTTKRYVDMSEDFMMRVYDNYNDEYKSEGQFAVVTFAYIGGIFQIINEDIDIANKEFPLVLDGPFSKCDPENRQNVVNCIPDYAPQIILFSKDDLNPLIRPDKLGNVYHILSNEYRNVATIEEA